MDREEIQLLVISLSIVFFTLLVILFVLFFYFQKKKTQFLIEKMEAELYFQSELVKTRVEIKDQTLSEISKELHDNIGQILSVAIMQVNLLSNTKNLLGNTQLKELKEVLTKAINEIRVLSRIINRENIIEINFVEAIQLDFDRIKKLKKINCIFNIEGKFPEINKEHELIIYRIFQEAIHNSLIHSRSEIIEMNIICHQDKFISKLKDYGVGFDLNSTNEGLGLNNMRLRAKLIGAELSIISNDNGTNLVLNYNSKSSYEN
jgi:signal transduction histidine kinase